MTDPAVRERDLPWPLDVDPARWLMGATNSGEPHRRAVVATWREVGHLRAQVAAVRALAEDAMKLPTVDDPRPADDRVSPRAILKALDEVAW